MIHSKTRQSSIINKLNRLGLSISYNRVQEILTTVTNVLCDKYKLDDNQIILTNLLANTFLPVAIDNIDHNPSSSTAADAFHGSSISVIQHLETTINSTPPLTDLLNVKWTTKIQSQLPESYTSVPVTSNVVGDPVVSTVHSLESEINIQPNAAEPEPWLASVDKTVGYR